DPGLKRELSRSRTSAPISLARVYSVFVFWVALCSSSPAALPHAWQDCRSGKVVMIDYAREFAETSRSGAELAQ
ncbi:MAG TPA: hypothetical protein VM686_02025, partial [Polyangiaceae bacterium]|nr:hypothetical protein [Polyangiaceae bacterium]